MNPELTIIIPTLNEEVFITSLLNCIQSHAQNAQALEILVADGGSNDATVALARASGAKIVHSDRGRPKQLNAGARAANGTILYFLHADTLPPRNFDTFILEAVKEGFESGCFRMKFDTKNPVLKFFAWLTRFNHILCRGGDQSLYITKKKFDSLEGFNEDYLIYEDSEFISRIYNVTKFKVHQETVITSARKYRERGWLRVQFHFTMIHIKNFLGEGPEDLFKYYERNLLKKK